MKPEPVAARRLAGGVRGLRSPRRAGVAAAALALLASGCAAGRNAQTIDQRPTLDGTNATIGSIALRGLSITAPPSSTPFYAAGAGVSMRLVLVNDGDRSDTLTSITSPAIGAWGSFTASPAAAAAAGATSVPIPPGKSVSWGVPDSAAQLKLQKLTHKVYPGSTVPLTFVFARAGSVTAQVPVQLTAAPNTSVIPGPSATGQNH